MIETKPKIDKFSLKGHEIWLLRDDLLGEFNGNKARKLDYFLNADLTNITKVISFGSSQSNAMYSLSVFAKLKGLEFWYVLSHLNSNLAQNPSGNFKFALQNGMKYFVQEKHREFALNLCDKNSLFIEEGVAQKEAEFGFVKQAREISEFAKQKRLEFDIFLPSGTGTSAAYLAKHSEFCVLTTPCVGDSNYLKDQIEALSPNSKAKILPPPQKYHFGKPKLELYQIWNELKNECGIEFDLIYDPVGFLCVLANLHRFSKPILYIHQGGILGNISQLQRYKYKFKDEIV